MGGSIAVHLAAKELIPSLVGMSVIDVVEGMFVYIIIYIYLYLSIYIYSNLYI